MHLRIFLWNQVNAINFCHDEICRADEKEHKQNTGTLYTYI